MLVHRKHGRPLYGENKKKIGKVDHHKIVDMLIMVSGRHG